jgi:hypothetical protein
MPIFLMLLNHYILSEIYSQELKELDSVLQNIEMEIEVNELPYLHNR